MSTEAESLLIAGLVMVVVLGTMYCTIEGTPWTPVARAKRERSRRVNARKAELIARGFGEFHTEIIAEDELKEEAAKQTTAFRSIGVE